MNFNKKTEIPNIFYDTVNEEPIQKCIMCEIDLMESQIPYMIEKRFKRKEAIFEYAICINCAEQMRNQMSRESLQAVEKYMRENSELLEQLEQDDFDAEHHENWMNTCAVTGNDISDLEEYQIFGLFQGKEMILNHFPHMIGGDSLESMQELLSAETKDELDRFRKEHFNIPPELEELFRGKPVLIF